MPPFQIPAIPDHAVPIVFAFGQAAINWGRMEQHLEMLLLIVNRQDYKLEYEARFPKTSFRLKTKLFERWYVNDPHFASIHSLAFPVFKALKKANKSRLLLTHSNVVEFLPGPPVMVKVSILKTKGDLIFQSYGQWTEQQIDDVNPLLCALASDLVRIGQITGNEAFQKSLRKELSEIQKVILWGRRRLYHLQHLCSRK
jgi:hypothetical protein